MENRKWYQSRIFTFALLALLGAAMGAFFSSPVYAEDSIDVQCYVRNGDDYVPAGNTVVYTASEAAATCNAVYVDCKGQCIGCFLNDEDDEYCYDNAGRKFQR